MTSIVTRLRGRSLDELRVRGVQALRARLERFCDRFVPVSGAGAARRRALPILGHGAGLLATASGAAIDPASVARAAARLDPELHEQFLAQADGAARGRIALLGHAPLWVGNPPRWQREPMSGVEAPRRHWSRIDHLDTATVGDHKVIWELNRHQYLLAPAFCWLLDHEARHFELIESHLDSWLADNPPRQGINWVSSLELALRAIAWCWLLWLLRAAPWRAGLRERLALSLEAHARHIERYLSTYFSPNTHLTGEALGLFYVGTLLAGSAHAARWRGKGAAILESAITKQVYPDGVYFEQASLYQRYTAEIYLHYFVLGTASGWPVSQTVRDRLGALLATLRTLADSRGRIPLLGDDDGGMLLPLDHRLPEDVRALLLGGAVALARPELQVGAGASASYAYWLCGIEPTDRLRAAGGPEPAWLDDYFACGGLCILRDGWKGDAAVAVIDAGPHGSLSCGHSHADALAMTLALGGAALFIDRGTLTYTGPERNEFRATASHNTLEIDGSSSVSPSGALFKWLPGIPPRAQARLYSSAHFSGVLALAPGHSRGSRASLHCRRVLHRRGGAWVIHDRAAREGARSGVVRWQLAPQLSATRLTPQSVAVRDARGASLATIFLLAKTPVRLVVRDVSLRLGQRAAAQCLELETGAALEALTIVVPARRSGDLVSFEAAGGPDEGHVAWTDDTGRHRLSSGAPERVAELSPAEGAPCDLVWRIEGGADADRGALIAALPAARPWFGGAVHRTAELLEESGTMSVWAKNGGQWTALGVEEPRRG